MRVGVGYDSHRFDEARPLILGGVRIPDAPGLRGHSDADAVAHALIDAVLGAAALGDIGAMFPDTDPDNEGADSIEMLADAIDRIAEHGLCVVNADITVITEQPRIGTHVGAMRERLAQTLGTGAGAVSIKGKSNERMGWIGRGEGLAVIAVACLGPVGRVPQVP